MVFVGLLRRTQHDSCPIGLLPVGRTNSTAKQLLQYTNATGLKEVQSLANAAITIVRGKLERKDVIKVEPLENHEESSHTSKPIYAISAIQWGAYRDALTLRDKYWYFGPLREYGAFLFNAFGDRLTWNCNAKLLYSLPCNGCSNCFVQTDKQQTNNRRWWSAFIPRMRPSADQHPDYSKVVNVNCQTQIERDITPGEVFVANNVQRPIDQMPKLTIHLGKQEDSAIDFIRDSWSRLKNDNFALAQESLDIRSAEIYPDTLYSDDKEIYFSIDNEAYEVKPVRVSVLPRAVQLFCL